MASAEAAAACPDGKLAFVAAASINSGRGRAKTSFQDLCGSKGGAGRFSCGMIDRELGVFCHLPGQGAEDENEGDRNKCRPDTAKKRSQMVHAILPIVVLADMIMADPGLGAAIAPA